MSRITSKNLSRALVVVFVVAAVLVPAAGARTGPNAVQPDWTCLSGAPCVMSPWYARDAAVRTMQQQRSRLVPAVRRKHEVRSVQHQRTHRGAYRTIANTLGPNGRA